MQAKKVRNRPLLLMWLVLACLTLLPLFAPQASYAYTFTAPDLGLGGPVPCPGDGLVRRIAPCIKETIIMAAYNNLIPFSAYIAKTVSVCCILAVIFLGVNMLSGKGSAPMRDGLMTMIKIGFVMTFTWNFGGNTLDPSGTHGGSFGAMLDVMDELLFFVAYYVINSSWFAFDYICDYHGDTDNVLLVWDTIDCAIETLVGGIYSPFTLSMGIIGFLFSCLLSNSIGFTIGMMGISLIFQLLGAVFQCVYIYLSAYMGVAFMVIISPLFIPLVLFTPTKSYFEKWLKTTTSFMIQPIIVFAYLSMLLAAFDTVVFTGDNSLLRTIAGDDAKDPDFNLNGGIGWWMLTNGGYTTRDMAGQAVNIDTKSLRAAGLLPNNSDNEGMVGDISNRMLNYAATQQQGTMNVLGVGAGAKPRFFEIDIPGETVNWEKLAQYHNYPSSTAYLLTVLISAFMAIVTGYIFLDMLKVLPFIGSRVAMGGGLSDGKELKAGLGMGENAPKLPDVGKGFKMGGGTGSTGKS